MVCSEVLPPLEWERDERAGYQWGWGIHQLDGGALAQERE